MVISKTFCTFAPLNFLKMKKIIYVLFCTLLVAGCNQPKNEPKDILHPDFDVRYKKLLKDGFHLYPEGGHSFFVKQIGDTFLSYQFEDLRYLTKKGKPKYVSARFSINSFHTDSINLFFHERGYIRICEQSSDPLTNMFDIFYVKHPLKNFIFSVKIDKEN
ncbi:MAG: hypothetical protein LBP96_04020 [Bacteroidales bacterium]|nr:hypothetical protein [Bacteroidales bacterium]